MTNNRNHGGKRKGAGQKKKGGIAKKGLLLRFENEAEMERYKKLTPRERVLLALR